MEEDYYTDEVMQDFNDSFLNDEHPLYYELNPDELDPEDVYSEDAILEYDETGRISQTTAERLLQSGDMPQNSGCLLVLIVMIIVAAVCL